MCNENLPLFDETLFDDNIVGDVGEPLVDDIGAQVEEYIILEREAEAPVEKGAAVAENKWLENERQKYNMIFTARRVDETAGRGHIPANTEAVVAEGWISSSVSRQNLFIYNTAWILFEDILDIDTAAWALVSNSRVGLRHLEVEGLHHEVLLQTTVWRLIAKCKVREDQTR